MYKKIFKFCSKSWRVPRLFVKLGWWICIILDGIVLTPSTSIEDEVLPGLCAPEVSRGLYWNWTRSGSVFSQSCPGGATGSARWRCEGSAWFPHNPDLSHCTSVWVNSLKHRVSTRVCRVTDFSYFRLMVKSVNP